MSNASAGSAEPKIIQLTSAPVFRGPAVVTRDLKCVCSAVLIEHYSPEAYIAIPIQCFTCGRVTTTPSLEPGEILPASGLSLGKDGAFRIAHTVEVPAGCAVTVDAEIQREQEHTRPVDPPLTTHHTLDSELFDWVEAQYDRLTGGCFGDHLRAVQRGLKVGNENIAKKYSLVWACSHLRARIASGVIMLNERSDLYAISAIKAFQDCVSAWQHHPRFAEIGKSFASGQSFNHHIAMFATAGYLMRVANRVGFAIPGGEGRTADLYMRDIEKIHIEVKAPPAFYWPSAEVNDPARMQLIVQQQLRAARGQISSEKPGILVIASGLIETNTAQKLRKAVRDVLFGRIRISKGLLGIVTVSTLYPIASDASGRMVITHGYNFDVEKSPSYRGPLCLITESTPRCVG